MFRAAAIQTVKKRDEQVSFSMPLSMFMRSISPHVVSQICAIISYNLRMQPCKSASRLLGCGKWLNGKFVLDPCLFFDEAKFEAGTLCGLPRFLSWALALLGD